ncbi:hypothetical protein EB796_021934 [Bugula neritina]|uniref:Uncharacterized protein n=1 Tax=Bugula neritina TaxID=10212 RepID=A0A7J7J1U0_BUGNE|nr:hypothetical protein EB796_021934 [Bugula neritina]
MEENKRHSAEMELQKKLTVNLSQQVQKLTAELNKVKSTVTATEAEKAKLAENVAELEKKVATLEATLESNKEDISKKEGLINELKKLGRNYRLKYNKLLEAQGSGSGTGSGTGAASAGEDSTSGAPPTSQASNEAVSKLQTELSALKDTLASKEAEITRLTSEIEASQKAKDDLASLKNEFSELTEKHNKVKADFEELNSKNTALKDFVNVSLKPKLAAQKKDLEKKSEETKQLKDKAAELENQLEEAQQNLDESRAKLLSLEEKSASSQSSNQSGHITASTDSKRSQVRTIEVRPMAQQQPKQPTLTAHQPKCPQSSSCLVCPLALPRLVLLLRCRLGLPLPLAAPLYSRCIPRCPSRLPLLLFPST